MIHCLKIQEEFADAVISGDKCFEIRLNDRGYQRGDYIKFTVMEGSFKKQHLLNECAFEITYVLNGWGIKEDYVVLGIKEVGKEDEKSTTIDNLEEIKAKERCRAIDEFLEMAEPRIRKKITEHEKRVDYIRGLVCAKHILDELARDMKGV